MDWWHRAACIDEDPEMFFPVGDGPPARIQEQSALRVCGRCLVMSECRCHALTRGEEFGVWGGTTESERRAIRRADRLTEIRR